MKMAIGAALLAGLPAPGECAADSGAGNRSSKRHSGRERHCTAAPSDGRRGAAAAQRKRAASTTPATTPPPINLLSPSAPLNAKEQQAVALARRWKSRAEMPQRGENGEVRFLYGATLPTVVCAPLQVCDLALQPGEIVNNVNVGDKVRWNISPGVSGSADGRVTHLIIKPADAGLVSSLVIETDRRTYAIKLVSTQHEWMPLVAFNYPDDMQRQWSAYQQTVAFGAAASRLPDR